MRLYYPEKDVDKSKSEAEQEQVGLATVSLKVFVPSRSGQEKADPWGRLCKRKGDGERPSNAFPTIILACLWGQVTFLKLRTRVVPV